MKKISKLFLTVGLILLVAGFNTSCNDDDDVYYSYPRKLVSKITDGTTEYTFEYNDQNFLTKYTKTDGASTETNTLTYDGSYNLTKRVNVIDAVTKTYEYAYSDGKVLEKDADTGIAMDTLKVDKYSVPSYSSQYFASPDTEIKNTKYEYKQYISYVNLDKKTEYEYTLDGAVKKEKITTSRYKVGNYAGIYSYYIDVPFWFRMYRLPFCEMGLVNDAKEVEIEEVYKEDGVEKGRQSKTIEYDVTYDNMAYPLTISWEEGAVTRELKMEYKTIILNPYP